MTNTKALQQSDKHCIRIAKLMEDPRSRFHKRDSYGYDDNGLLYHINGENDKEYKATMVPKTLIKKILLLAQNDKTHTRPCRQLFLVSMGEDAG